MKAELQEDYVCENCGYTSPTENTVCPDCGLAMKSYSAQSKKEEGDELDLSEDFADLPADDETTPLSLEQLQSEEEESELKSYSTDSFGDDN